MNESMPHGSAGPPAGGAQGIPNPRKRSYNATSDQDTAYFADKPFYALDPDDFKAELHKTCNKLVHSIEKHASIDERIRKFIQSIVNMASPPKMEEISIAVLGEQGNGKSSLINALMDRQILDTSGGCTACTTYATVITHKEDADDQSSVSDIKVEFWTDPEVDEVVSQMIERWVEFCPGANDLGQDDIDDTAQAGPERPTQGDSESVADGDLFLEDMDDDDSSDIESKTMPSSAKTALEFFKLVFDTDNDEQADDWLNQILYHTDIREGVFGILCCQKAKECLCIARTQLGARNSFAAMENVSDEEWEDQKGVIDKIWPFVKVVTIATGNILLRYGIQFFDLPGYSDSNQLRHVIINDFRKKADIEMVIVPLSRSLTNVVQQSYIDRSLNLKKDFKPILVLNKADEIVKDRELTRVLKKTGDKALLHWATKIQNVKKMFSDKSQDRKAVLQLRKKVYKEAKAAWRHYQTDLIEKSMQAKGIKVFTTSASSYLDSINPFGCDESPLTRAESGVDTLRQFMTGLPADVNFRNLRKHVSVTLPKLPNQARPILETHEEDQSYRQIRQALKVQIQSLQQTLEDLIHERLEQYIGPVWSAGDEKHVIGLIQRMIVGEWVHDKIRWNGFAKMLRENGIPINGKYAGQNLNRQILSNMLHYINGWVAKLRPKIRQLGDELHGCCYELTSNLRTSIMNSSASKDLKNSAFGGLSDAEDRIAQALETLVSQLGKSLTRNHVQFTNEIDIYCPIAKLTRPMFKNATDTNVVLGGVGVYKRQTKYLHKAVQNPPQAHAGQHGNNSSQAILPSFQSQAVDNQRRLWETDCATYVTETIAAMQAFSTLTEELLMNAMFMTPAHKVARADLSKALKDFELNLKLLRIHVDKVAADYDVKKAKVNHQTAEDATEQVPEEVPRATTEIGSSMASSTPTSQTINENTAGTMVRWLPKPAEQIAFD